MRNLLSLVVMVAVVVACTSGAQAFDGQRKGFVLGGGLGIAPVASWDSGFPLFEESKAGLGLNILIGYAWDEQNMIVYEGNGVGYKSDFGDANITQMFNGAVWYHYFGPKGKSFFTSAGLGVYQFVFEFQSGSFSASGSNDVGGAILLGAGYEFSPHYQVAAYVSSGKTSEPGFDYDHTHVSILFSAVAF